MLGIECQRTATAVVVEEQLGPRYPSALDGMTLSAHDDGTEITGPTLDSSHLHRPLERIAGVGLTLRSLSRLIARTRLRTKLARVVDYDAGTNQKGPT